jgi:simple sugar transport system permease protein
MIGTILLVILVSIIRLSIPIIITGLGNMFCEKAGIMNLGAEGMMIAGSFGAIVVSLYTGNPWIGVLAGIICGIIVAGIHGLICVEFGGIQNISGLGLNMLAAGLTSFWCRSLYGSGKSPVGPAIQSIPALGKVPLIGTFLSQFSPIFYIMIILFVISRYIIKKTILGLRMTAVGDDPQTVETAGINVWKLRHICVLVCGAFAGLAGAYLAVGQLNIFVENMTNGKGMMAVIAVKMGRWDPKRIVAIALMFGFFDAVQIQLQIRNVFNLPTEIIQTIPFLVGIIALAVDTALVARPGALNKPYLKNKYKF